MKKRRPGQVSLERALSKLGLASRSEARALILEGRVKCGMEVAGSLEELREAVPEALGDRRGAHVQGPS